MVISVGQARTLGELLEAAHQAERHFDNRQAWYRGHANANWSLVPSAHRRHPVLEASMMNLFRHRAPAIAQSCPMHQDYASWLPLMRHYGLPTRLLDWTESVCVAAYFAVRFDSTSMNSTIWMVSPGHLNLESIGDIVPFLHDDRVFPLVEAAFSGDEALSHVIAVIAPRDNVRACSKAKALSRLAF